MTEQDTQSIKEGIKERAKLRITRDINNLTLPELGELQHWLNDKKATERPALIKSINTLISDMPVETLRDIEAYIARIEG